MRYFITILSFLAPTFTFGQNLTDKYLHYKTDYYWDTTLYKSEQVYYYEVNKGKITQKAYPVLQYQFTKIISDSPLVTKDEFQRRNLTDYPYKYIRKENSIYLQYFDLGKRRLKLNRQYSLDVRDTVKMLANKSSLDSEDGISVGGFSTFLGEEKIEINGRQFQTFRFLEEHAQGNSHLRYYKKEVFLEKETLIPIKFVFVNYDDTGKQKLFYSTVTVLNFSGNILADYTNKTTGDLVLYEIKSTTWTEQQKQVFLSVFSTEEKQYADCLLKKLDGHIRFYHFEKSIHFRALLSNKECE